MTDYKKAAAHTDKAQTGGSKQVKAQFLAAGQPSDIGHCPPARLYTRSYEKVPDADDKTYGDTVSPFVGNPIIW